ncbi:glutamate synthase [Sinorhizobium medicae]|uniref:Chaperone NapD n=2 Tax=Sinorhizobium medicae TaxID=110321 RepID=A6UJX6_SINMW|nr:chaperone NapD [Sinorhizobium medicae]ABR63956.1 NapD family protein [Sinorhizobium medicae WSM419]MBO1945333.1 chaperone NapD [Sinorhizobium medicae]MBO1960137.1 chaperone NapD [Sinorhizobium medicae]MDX0411863.1 glutamate synthase [Sinorhizobium medicae]MDX0424163.1 glutamate synthase [Sinorhizobium medicae]
MSDSSASYHISSAVIMTMPHMRERVVATLAEIPNVEVYAHEAGKIVIVIEGTSTGMLGETLSRIALLEGVVAANMVFEHVETQGEIGHDRRTDAA